MILSSFDFKGGIVLHNDLNNEFLLLKEDLLQVEYSISKLSKLIVDLGWYGDETEQEGIFRIIVLKGNDWDNPIYIVEFNSLDELEIYLTKAIEFAKSSME